MYYRNNNMKQPGLRKNFKALSLNPMRYSGQILVFEFSYICQVQGAVNPSNVIKKVWNQNHVINIKHLFTSFPGCPGATDFLVFLNRRFPSFCYCRFLIFFLDFPRFWYFWKRCSDAWKQGSKTPLFQIRPRSSPRLVLSPAGLTSSQCLAETFFIMQKDL